MNVTLIETILTTATQGRDISRATLDRISYTADAPADTGELLHLACDKIPRLARAGDHAGAVVLAEDTLAAIGPHTRGWQPRPSRPLAQRLLNRHHRLQVSTATRTPRPGTDELSRTTKGAVVTDPGLDQRPTRQEITQ